MGGTGTAEPRRRDHDLHLEWSLCRSIRLMAASRSANVLEEGDAKSTATPSACTVPGSAHTTDADDEGSYDVSHAIFVVLINPTNFIIKLSLHRPLVSGDHHEST